jgi:hypothetical protein
VTNKYISKSDERPTYPWLTEGKLSGATILEPFKATTFNAIDALDAENVNSLSAISYNWKVERKASDQNSNELDLQLKRRVLKQLKGLSQEQIDEEEPVSELVASGKTAKLVHEFDQLGVHRVTVEATYSSDADGFVVLKTMALVVVKYVRRELHSVDDEDRQALMSAWQVLLETNDEDGVSQYGDDYRSFLRLSSEHNNLAGDKLCDHLHDGMGFLPAHVSLSRLLEASLQAVDASVTLPYW